jgi:hypothetical protein
MNNKKAITGLAIYGVLIVVILAAGILLYNQRVQAQQGVPTPPPDTSGSTQVNPPVTCPAGQLLDNSNNCIVPPCPVGYARDNSGTCVLISSAGQTTTPGVNPGFIPAPLEKPCEPTGYFKSVYAYHKKNIGDSSNINRGAPVSFQFVVTNECEANFYVEAGLLQYWQGLTILVTQPSACDGDPHFAGKFIKGSKYTKFTSTQPAGVIDVAFFPQDYGKQEKLRMVGGVYSGCLKDGAKTIAEFPPQILDVRATGNSLTSFSDTEITASVTRII